MKHVLIVNGPNLNLLGHREADIYGIQSLGELETRLRETAAVLELQISFFQNNAEHELLDRIHQAPADGIDFIVINPGAFTHTSIALRDALLAVSLPFAEVHISNIHARETFRQHSFFSDIARGVISGFGTLGYELSLQAAARILHNGE